MLNVERHGTSAIDVPRQKPIEFAEESRGERIRTSDPSVPNRAHTQVTSRLAQLSDDE